MRRVIPATICAGIVITWFATSHRPPVLAQGPATRIAPSSRDGVLAWDADVDRMMRNGTLRLRRERDDTLLAGRTLQQLDQYVGGVRIWGSGVSRQLNGREPVSVFGMLSNVSDAELTPAVSQDAAKRTIEETIGTTLGPARLPELVLLPGDGAYTLAWVADGVTLEGRFRVFVDARTGSVARRDNITETQLPAGSYVGHGTGVFGDNKKLSTDAVGSGFIAFDTIRPPVIGTFDLRANTNRGLGFLNGVVRFGDSDYASTGSSNDWTDGAVVDAHVYASYTYDYYFKRFGRRGLDNGDIPITNLVHLVRRADIFGARDITLWDNAFYAGDGVMVYGEGCDCTIGGQKVNYLSAGLDVVAHELTHGVTDYSSNLEYRDESGALNEAFSDIMGTSIEFFFEPAGTGRDKADYLIGEDVFTASFPGTRDGIRSMADPGAFGDPDHYSLRYTGTSDNGGVHTNSSIVNHAFYLAIEGGTNRTSGLRVQGVGATNRLQIERVFYRAFTQLMPSNANFQVARAVTLQAAQDLYGTSSAAYAAVRDAWTAVGVN